MLFVNLGTHCCNAYGSVWHPFSKEARNAMNWFIFVTVGASFGIGLAMTNLGLSNMIAVFVTNIGAAIGLKNTTPSMADCFFSFMLAYFCLASNSYLY
jgi:hypothetical protein